MMNIIQKVLFVALWPCVASSLAEDAISLAKDYFRYKNVVHVCYFTCKTTAVAENVRVVKRLMASDIRVSMMTTASAGSLTPLLHQWQVAVGVLMDGTCDAAHDLLEEASRSNLFDSTHMWLIIDSSVIDSTVNDDNGADSHLINPTIGTVNASQFQRLPLSADTDLAVAVASEGGHYKLTDVYNFGKIQGNPLETNLLGTWDPNNELSIILKGYKYYHRWDFNNLTFRAISVIRDGRPASFDPSMLWRREYTPGVTHFTKVSANLLNVLKHHHNFGFNLTIAGTWVVPPTNRNAIMGLTDALYWRTHDMSFTSIRINKQWMQWCEPFLPPVTKIETKFYYLVKERGVGAYENRFLTPLSPGAWAGALSAGAVGALVLAAAAARERRPHAAAYAVASVMAAFCQQGYEDGVQILGEFSSQGRRCALVVVGLMTMLVYNYYTSSVVSWLLSAAPPSIASMEQLAAAPLQLAFEDVGYTRTWLERGSTYYYSGWKNPKEALLRDKALQPTRTLPLLMPVEMGVQHVRSGNVAYHTEPNEALRVIASRFSERELCELAALQMMPASASYIVAQRRSPYKEFFKWSLMRLLERGVMDAVRARVTVRGGRCGGQSPRMLALGQAAPALLVLAAAAALAAVTLLAEIVHHRCVRENCDKNYKGRSNSGQLKRCVCGTSFMKWTLPIALTVR